MLIGSKMPNIFKEGKMTNISPTLKVDIYVTLGIINKILIGADY
jgi:hypothetical protein